MSKRSYEEEGRVISAEEKLQGALLRIEQLEEEIQKLVNTISYMKRAWEDWNQTTTQYPSEELLESMEHVLETAGLSLDGGES